jgi:glycosyltransferase involved in cell wall biosynthesis
VGEPPDRPAPILVVSNHGHVAGGGELSLMDLLGGLDKSRWAPTLVVPGDGEVASRGRDLGLSVHVVPLPSLRRPGPGVLRSIRALGRLARVTDAALIHANGSRAMIYGALAARAAGRPAIWHVRIAERDPVVDHALYALATAVIATSRAVARRFRPASRKVCVIPNGVDLARFTPRRPSPALGATLGIPPSSPVVLSIGRFVAEKGQRHLLEAAARMERTKPGVHWILVGAGELEGELRAQARRLGLEARVHFTGWRNDIPDVLALGDVFALPSEREGFGRVLVEAMALARAVVATDVGGVPEIVVDGQTGILVPSAAPGPLADAVRALLDDPARAARLGAAGRARAESTFSLTAHVGAVERVYAEIGGAVRAPREVAPIGRRTP